MNTARRLRRHRPTHAVRLATLVVGAADGDSGSVLRTHAVNAFSSDFHPIAAAAPSLFPCIVLRGRFTSCSFVPAPIFSSPPLPVTVPCRARYAVSLPRPVSLAHPVADAPGALRLPTSRHGPCLILHRLAWRQPPATLTARRLRRHRRTRAVRLAALAPSNVLLKSVQFSIAIDTIDICSPSARTPLHGPRRRGPASRLPCATRRRGPFPLLRTGPPFLLRLAGAGSARHRLPHPAVLGVHTTADAAADASGNVLRTPAVSAFSGDLQSIAAAPPLFPRIVSRSRPSTSCGIVPTPVFNSTTVAGDATLSSLLRGPPSSARHLSRLWSLTLPPRFVCRQLSATLTARRLRRHAPPHPRHRCGLRPSPASAPRRPRCPHHCGRRCRRFRQRASHACRQRLQH